MRVPPASRGSSGPNSLLILIFLLSTTLFCGMAGAETMVITCPYGQTDPVCLPWGVITVFIDESSGGDLGQRFVTGEYECNYEMLNYNTPRLTGCENIINSPATVTLPFTIPDGVNLSRMYTRPYISFDGPGDSAGGTNLPGCDAVAPWWGCEDPVYYINDVEMTDWQVGSGDFGRVDPAILHTGENTLKIHSEPLWTYIDYQGYSGGPFYQGYVEIDHLYVTLQTYLDPSAKPELLDLTITPEMLVTGHDITISPVVKPGTPDWEILGISYYVTDINTGAQELHRALPDTSNLTFRPGPGAYGRKWLIAKMHIRDGLSGHQEISEFRVPIHIYFDKGRYPDFVDDDGNDKPNWFE